MIETLERMPETISLDDTRIDAAPDHDSATDGFAPGLQSVKLGDRVVLRFPMTTTYLVPVIHCNERGIRVETPNGDPLDFRRDTGKSVRPGTGTIEVPTADFLSIWDEREQRQGAQLRVWTLLGRKASELTLDQWLRIEGVLHEQKGVLSGEVPDAT